MTGAAKPATGVGSAKTGHVSPPDGTNTLIKQELKMALRNIVEKGDPILRKKSREVSEVTDRIRILMEDMVETMHHGEGVGLAGPQVGVMRRLFVAEPAPGEVYYMINPEMIEQEGLVEDTEGCLSVPGYYGIVERPQKIRMRAMDLDGNINEYEFEDFAARVMCHEYDHLEGILYTDKASEVHMLSEQSDDEAENGEIEE